MGSCASCAKSHSTTAQSPLPTHSHNETAARPKAKFSHEKIGACGGFVVGVGARKIALVMGRW